MFNNVFGKKLKLGERKKKFESYKRFFKNMGPNCHILMEKYLNSPHVQTNFKKLPIYRKNLDFLKLPPLNYNQIWLSPLVHDYHPT